jgi:2-dehydro-3-deoxygluconokinase
MSNGLKIQSGGALDLVSLGALIHRLDPGVIPFRKATSCQIHTSGGEFNVAANLADCFRLNTGIVTGRVSDRRSYCRAGSGNGSETVLQEI